jgi:hypothetical protein
MGQRLGPRVREDERVEKHAFLTRLLQRRYGRDDRDRGTASYNNSHQ